MRRIVWLLLLTVFLGCETETTQRKSKPIPPDDLSNGPWKNQRQQSGSQRPATETPTTAESN